MSLYSRAKDSEFLFTQDNGNIKVLNAVIVWKNFSGKPNRFGSTTKTFSVVLTEDIGEQLKECGWNVRFKEGREPGDDPLITTEIVVNMNSEYPPVINLCSEINGRKSMRRLSHETIDILDSIEFARADVIIHPFEWDPAEHKVKGYLSKLNVIQALDADFGDIYAGYDVDMSAFGDSVVEEGDIPF